MALTRQATPAEIIEAQATAIRYGYRVSYRHFIHERMCKGAKHGVKHIEKTASKITVTNGVPFVRYMGEMVELTGTFYKSAECTFICDLRVKSQYLPTNV